MLALVATSRLTKIDWKALQDREWFPYSYDEGKIMVLLVELPIARRSAGGAKALEGG